MAVLPSSIHVVLCLHGRLPIGAWRQFHGIGKETLSNRRLILVVEDDPALRVLWRSTLRFAGLEVIEAGDGVDALRLIEQRLPDLIVLDLGLPRLGGLSVQQEIAAQAVTRHVPIVIVTGSTEDLSHVKVPCVLRKPVSPDDLVATVRRCLLSGAPGIGS